MIFDETLRDGEQTPGVSFNLTEKCKIMCALDELGVDLVDIGFPSVSKEEFQIVRKLGKIKTHARKAVTSRMNRKDIESVIASGIEEVFLFISVSPIHMKYKLGLYPEDILKLSLDLIKYAVQNKLVVHFVAEDAARADEIFLIKLAKKLEKAGISTFIYCDTVGVLTPTIMKNKISKFIEQSNLKIPIGIHCHNDFGLANANTVVAVEEGVSIITATMNGIGERAGNASIEEVSSILKFLYKFNININFKKVKEVSELVEEFSGIFVPANKPIIGLNAFRHESGVHVNGLLKHLETYEPIKPEYYDLNRKYVIGKHSGSSLIIKLLKENNLDYDDRLINEILNNIKEYYEMRTKINISKKINEFRSYENNTMGFSEANLINMAKISLRGKVYHE